MQLFGRSEARSGSSIATATGAGNRHGQPGHRVMESWEAGKVAALSPIDSAGETLTAGGKTVFAGSARFAPARLNSR
jgi:hypothetical protein